ncbi:hypothetical protein EYR40_003466 [Pleurotus pulmonarius]|nr:hypothetical protein EYR40_003466 [Pleurotus pulmonarius]KAF4606189.1 hypothetical protein EYR38_000238 [Pleurotus pulmonarius]
MTSATFSYGLSSLVIDRSALGSFGKIPTELIHHILDAAGLHDGLMLSATNGQFFTICYPCIQARIKRVEATSFWSHDRVICIGQGETTLPDGCLTEDEKNAIMTWAFWYDFDFNEQDGERPGFCIPSKRLVKGTLNIIETEEYVHMCEDLGMTLYRYGCAMPALSDPDRLELAVPSKIIKADEVSKGDRQRIIQLRRLVVDRLGLEHPTLRRTDKVLVNITKREYVMATDREGRYVLEKAIPQLTCWGTKEGEHGDWAGDRLAVISCSELEEKLQQEEGWKEKVEQWDSDFE